MGFIARVYIQGVGLIRDDKTKLEAYFPTNEAARDFGLIDARGVPINDTVQRSKAKAEPICTHHAFIQFSARNLDPQNHDVWLTAILDREEVEVEAAGSNVNPLQVGTQGRITNYASLQDVLGGIIERPRQLRRDLEKNKGRLLRAKLRIAHGKVTSDSPNHWRLGFESNGKVRRVQMSGVLQVELGEVDELALRITSFNGKGKRILRLSPAFPTNAVDVWIRHYCAFDRPTRDPAIQLAKGDTDPDFVLNYSLLEGIRHLSKQQKRALPIPVIAAGGQIGNNHTICQGVKV